MRHRLLIAAALPFASAVPAAAQEAPQVAVPPQVADSLRGEIDRLLDDPALPQKAGAIAGTMVDVLRAMPIGQFEAAAEGREPTSQDMERTVGDEVDIDGERVGKQVATALVENRRRIDAGVDAMVATLPYLIVAMEKMRTEMARLERD